MKRYETVLIIDPDISEEDRKIIIEKLKEAILKQNGTLLVVDEWGSRKLAYTIKKKVQGYYLKLDFCGDGKAVDEIERLLDIDDRILKYMTILIDKKADLAKIKEELSNPQTKPTPVDLSKVKIKDDDDEDDGDAEDDEEE